MRTGYSRRNYWKSSGQTMCRGESTAATSGFLSDSLADDVVAVLDSLDIHRPVVVGHSIAGQELSSIGSRHPERVAGLIYLDAGFQYAHYDSAETHVQLLIRDTGRKLARLGDPSAASTVRERGQLIEGVLESNTLSLLERDLRQWQRDLATAPNQSAIVPAPVENPALRRLTLGTQKYTSIKAPMLALFALPRETPPAMAATDVLREMRAFIATLRD